jgi:N-methylhydantoinase A/oxoprolinase/acetone carboxylase beta subunit
VAHRLGIDIGGTFTDLTVIDDADGTVVAVNKVPSVPADPLRAVAAGLDGLASRLAGDRGSGTVGLVLHGTTVGLNALLTEHVAEARAASSPGGGSELPDQTPRRHRGRGVDEEVVQHGQALVSRPAPVQEVPPPTTAKRQSARRGGDVSLRRAE